MRIGFISNPSAGANRRHPRRLAAIDAALGPTDRHVRTRSVAQVERALREFREHHIDTLAINGGDGTIHWCLTVAHRVWDLNGNACPFILLVPGGTFDSLVTDLQLPSKLPTILAALPRLTTAEGEPSHIRTSVLRIGENIGLTFGLGLTGQVVEEYKTTAHPGAGKLAAVTLRTVLSAAIKGSFIQKLFAPIPAKIIVDGQNEPLGEVNYLVASSIERTGFLVRFPAAANRNRARQFSLSYGIVKRRDLPRIFAAPLSQKLFPSCIQIHAVRGFEVITRQDAPYTIDGDAYRLRGDLRVESCGPIRVLDLRECGH